MKVTFELLLLTIFTQVTTQDSRILVHYAKSIWARVKKDGLAKFYSKDSIRNEPKLCSPSDKNTQFVKLPDIPRGIQNLKKVANLLTLKKCPKFTNSMMIYVENFWLKLDLKMWNMFEVKVRTNN